MQCPYCAGPVETPEPQYPAWCPACDKTFQPQDWSWFRIAGMEFTQITVWVGEGE